MAGPEIDRGNFPAAAALKACGRVRTISAESACPLRADIDAEAEPLILDWRDPAAGPHL